MNWPFWRKPKKYVRMKLSNGEFVIIGGDVEPERLAKIMFAFAPDYDWQALKDAWVEKYGWIES